MVRHIIETARFVFRGIRRIVNHLLVGTHLIGDDQLLTNQVHRIGDRLCAVVIGVRLVGVHLVLYAARHLVNRIAKQVVYTRVVFRPNAADRVLGRLINLQNERIQAIDTVRMPLFLHFYLRLRIIGEDLLRVVSVAVIHRVALRRQLHDGVRQHFLRVRHINLRQRVELNRVVGWNLDALDHILERRQFSAKLTRCTIGRDIDIFRLRRFFGTRP